jgi:HKD family nuclease
MQTALHVQSSQEDPDTLAKVLDRFSASSVWNDLRVAVAYASVAGLLRLLEVLRASRREGFSSKWLFGLDDYLTQPGVLRTCFAMPNAELRIARLLPEGRRFHPKLLMVRNDENSCFACVGSSNLTLGGLTKNCEAYAELTASTRPEIEDLDVSWRRVWNIGATATEQDIDNYEDEYNERAPDWPDSDDLPEDGDAGDTAPTQPSSILTSDSPSLDPALATICWIEVGKNTAMGRELEFKAEQAMFFGLSPGGGPPQFRSFLVSSGNPISLRLKYQVNAMWRLQMNNEIPEVAIGLRPRDPVSGELGRSPFVAVISRTDDRNSYVLRFIRDDGEEYRDLRRRSERAGTSGRTSARRYGWC